MRRAASLILVVAVCFTAGAAASALTISRSERAVSAFLRHAKARTPTGDEVPFDSYRIARCHRVSTQRVDCGVTYVYSYGFSATQCSATVTARLHERRRLHRSWVTTYFHGTGSCYTSPISHS
jgi:hypothetical protein